MKNQTYSDLIKKIKRKRKIALIVSIILIIFIMSLVSPSEIVVLDEVIYSSEGLHPVLIGIIFILCLFGALMLYTGVSMPVYEALNSECDPHKHLALNLALNTKDKNLDATLSADYFYIGNYEDAILHAEKLIERKSKSAKLVGLFNKSRALYFSGKYTELSSIVDEYEALLGEKNQNSKIYKTNEMILISMRLITALANNNEEDAGILSEALECWGTSKATEVYVNYLKGIAAQKAGNKDEAIYRLSLAKDIGKNTALAPLADEIIKSQTV